MKVGKIYQGWIVILACSFSLEAGQILYQTGFEASEGYDASLSLGGQRNWLIEGSGGNGLVTNFFEGFGQQGFIGFTPPTNTAAATTIWTPINFNPVPSTNKIVKFSVKLQLFKSTVGGDDEFRWAVYNQDAKRLFAIDFFMDTQKIYFDLEDQQANDTGYTFDFDGSYDLVTYMDFGRNQWTAFLNDRVIANAQPLRLTNTTTLDFGDADAVWFINDVQSPGDNFMVFDDYTITVEDLTSIPGGLESLGMNDQGFFSFRVHGEIGVNYAIDVTSDFASWTQLYPGPGETFTNTEGTFQFEDTTAPDFRLGFYRLREVR